MVRRRREWWTSQEVAALTGDVNRSTIYRQPVERLPYITTPGGHRRYRREDVYRYAAELGVKDEGWDEDTDSKR